MKSLLSEASVSSVPSVVKIPTTDGTDETDKIRALIFDCDGVLADTERDGHLPAFNQMWAEMGVPWRWSVEQYGEKLKIAGGKERMASLFADPEFRKRFPAPVSEKERQDLIMNWHQRKSAIYMEAVSSGRILPRSGVRRLAEEALARGWKLAVASTSALRSVEAVLLLAMGQKTREGFSYVAAGDMVKAKKPAPDIYLLAAQGLGGVAPQDCVVIEDSSIGVAAAVAAGMRCAVTVNGYTADEDFTQADIVLSCLGDPGGETCRVLQNRTSLQCGPFFTAKDLAKIVLETSEKD